MGGQDFERYISTKTSLSKNSIRHCLSRSKLFLEWLKTHTKELNNESALVFEGWDIPIKTDGDISIQGPVFKTSTMRGNACLNLVGDMQLIKEWVLSKNLNENFTRFDEVIHIDGEKETPIFPEVPTHHAVVERIRAQA